MHITVMSRSVAEQWCRCVCDGIPTAIISITDPRAPLANLVGTDTNNPVNGLCDVLRVQFMDTDIGSPDCIQEEHARKIAEFVLSVKDSVDRLIVHCEAGQSRSAGVAAAILKYLTGSDDSIYCNVRYTPNSTCYRRVLNALYELESINL